MMTSANIHAAIYLGFRALYPTGNIIIHGAGTEEITVTIQPSVQYLIHFKCELPSDDDGFFHFLLDDCTLTVLIPYPE